MPVTASSSTTRIFTLPIMVPPGGFKGKLYSEFCSTGTVQGNRAKDLPDKGIHQLEPQRLGMVKVKAFGKPDSVIPDSKGILVTVFLEVHSDHARAFIRKCIFQGIREHLVDHQADGNRLADRKNYVICMDIDTNLLRGNAV